MQVCCKRKKLKTEDLDFLYPQQYVLNVGGEKENSLPYSQDWLLQCVHKCMLKLKCAILKGCLFLKSSEKCYENEERNTLTTFTFRAENREFLYSSLKTQESTFYFLMYSLFFFFPVTSPIFTTFVIPPELLHPQLDSFIPYN